MPPIGLAASLGLGAPRSATASGLPHGSAASYDTDAQAYFDALLLDGITPSAAQKLAISNYFITLKADSNFTPIKALYLPIWADVDANDLNAVNPGTYDLTFGGTVTQASGYIEGDGTTGFASAGFRGPAGSPKFVTLLSASFSANILTGSTETAWDSIYGWYREATLYATSNPTTNSFGYPWYYNGGTGHFANSGVPGLWTMNTDTPTGANTNKFNIYKDASLMASTEKGTWNIYSTTKDWMLLGAAGGSGVTGASAVKVNFAHAGAELTSFSDFQTATATLLAAL